MNIIGISDTAKYMEASCRIIYNIIIFIKCEIMKETGRAEKLERSSYALLCSPLFSMVENSAKCRLEKSTSDDLPKKEE